MGFCKRNAGLNLGFEVQFRFCCKISISKKASLFNDMHDRRNQHFCCSQRLVQQNVNMCTHLNWFQSMQRAVKIKDLCNDITKNKDMQWKAISLNNFKLRVLLQIIAIISHFLYQRISSGGQLCKTKLLYC